MPGATCALPGCSKPPWPSVPQGDSPALACGNLHHQLLMAWRFNPTLPFPPHQAIRDRNTARLCALSSCEEAPYVGHSWCSRTHYLEWLKKFTSSLQPDQICMLPGCTRHVFVDEGAPPSQFCGWRHEQKFVMLGALQHRPLKESRPPAEALSQQLPSSAPLDEDRKAAGSECREDRSYGNLGQSFLISQSKHSHQRPSLHSRMRSLKQFAHFGIAPKNMRVIEDFFEKHPWQILTEGQDCWLIARLKFTSKKTRKLTTKDHFHWKQSGRRAKRSTPWSQKYYGYEKLKGKEKGADEEHAESTYTMREYTAEDVGSYSLIHLSKEKPSIGGGKIGKKRHGKQRENAELADDACSQDTRTSKCSSWKDNSSVESTFRGLDDLFSVSQIPVA